MADKTPVRYAYDGSSLTGIAEYATSDTVGVPFGGTGVVTIGSNQLVTGNGTSAITSESNLTFDGTILKATGDLCATVKVVAPALCIGSEYVLPTADGSAGQLMCTDGSGALAFATATAGVTLAGSTNNTIATVTGANALAGEANLTFDGTILKATGDLCATVKVVAPALCIGSEYVLPTADGSAGQIMCTDGSGALAFATAASSGADPTSTNTWTADQTFNDNVKVTLGTGGDADLYYDGTNVILNPRVAGNGNVGLNTTTIPAWDSQYFALYTGGAARGVVANTGAAAGGSLFVTNNLYHDGSNWKYAIANEEGTAYSQSNGSHFFQHAASTSHSADANATVATSLSITSAGFVGIGTTAPGALLAVKGNVAVGSSSSNATLLGNQTAGGLDVMVGSGSKAFQVWSDNCTQTPRFMVERAGNVGINMNLPLFTLDVNGCVKAQNGFLVGWNTTNPKRVCDGGDRCLFFTNDMCYNCALWGHNMYWSIKHCGSERWNMFTSGSSCCYRHMGITISNGGGLTGGWYQGNDPICGSCRYFTSPCRVCAGTDLIAPSKSFIINHPCCDADTPNKFNSMLLKHVTSEAPEYNVFYRGSATLCNGIAIVELPEYFESLTHDDDRTVQLTAVGGWSPLTVKTHVEGGQFEVCTTAEGDLAQEFDWRVDARRFDGYIREEALEQGVVNEDGDMIDEYWKPESIINDTPEEPDNLDALDEDDIKEMLNHQDIDVDDTDTKEELLVKLREPWETRMERGAVRESGEDPPAHRVANLLNIDKSKPNPGKKKNRRQK